MGTLRTKETKEKYKKYIQAGNLERGCNLCKASSLEKFKYWRIVKAAFPYDRVAAVHHMVVTKRCVTEPELTEEEVKEFKSLKLGYINENYEFILEAVNKMKTIPGHIHYHLVVVKD